jgi:hypothetical protein
LLKVGSVLFEESLIMSISTTSLSLVSRPYNSGTETRGFGNLQIFEGKHKYDRVIYRSVAQKKKKKQFAKIRDQNCIRKLSDKLCFYIFV